MSPADIGGWIGTFLVLAAYAYVTIRKDPDVWFQLANGFGAVLLGLDGLSHNAMPVVGLNVAWCIISIVGLGRLWHQAYVDTVRLERESIRATLPSGNIPFIKQTEGTEQ